MALNLAQTTSQVGRRLLHSSARLYNAAASASASASSQAEASSSGAPSTSSPLLRPVVPQLPRHEVQIGPTHQGRYEAYYNHSLSRDLLYLTYDHQMDLRRIREEEKKQEGVERRRRSSWDLSSPYMKNRPERTMRRATPSALKYVDTVVELDRIVITSFHFDPVNNKQALIPLLAVFRAITGKPVIEAMEDPQLPAQIVGNLPKTGYVRLIHSKKNVQAFKLRKDQAVGVQAVLPRKSAYEFLEVFTNFVLPRLRGFNGFALPPPSQAPTHLAATSGVVSLGMDGKFEALGLFPQTEVNWDNYPFKKVPGFQVDCITNQRGERASEKARQLLSGLGVPFARRGEM